MEDIFTSRILVLGLSKAYHTAASRTWIPCVIHRPFFCRLFSISSARVLDYYPAPLRDDWKKQKREDDQFIEELGISKPLEICIETLKFILFFVDLELFLELNKRKKNSIPILLNWNFSKWPGDNDLNWIMFEKEKLFKEFAKKNIAAGAQLHFILWLQEHVSKRGATHFTLGVRPCIISSFL